MFRATPVAEVAARLEERFGTSVALPAAWADEGFTGTFVPEQSAEVVLTVLATTLDARVEGSLETGFRLVPGRE